MSSKRDVESGERTLYPTMLESPELRWSFIRKVYSIITFQLLLTIAVASVVVFFPPIPRFFVSTTPGLVLYIVLIFIPLISTSSLLFLYILLLTILFIQVKYHPYTLFLCKCLILQHYVHFTIITTSTLSITSSS